MTELSFAKSFLTILDQRPSKISADHIEDPRNYPAQNAYILPRMPNPPKKPTPQTSTPPPPKAYTITLTSTRNPPLSHTLTSQTPTTSIHELKTALSTSASIPIDKLKILWNKRPVPDSKVIKDFVVSAGEGKEEMEEKLEFGVMVIGGAASVVQKAVEGKGEVEMSDVPVPVPATAAAPAPEPAASELEEQKAAPVAQGVSGMEVIESEEFWGDLEGFLMLRVRDEDRSKKLLQVFRQGFENHKAEF